MSKIIGNTVGTNINPEKFEDEGYVKSQNNKDVEITTKEGIYPAYFRLRKSSLKAEVYGFGGVDIKAGGTNPVKISANEGVEISSSVRPVIIKNLATPSVATDPATKEYVDDIKNQVTALTQNVADKANKSELPTRVSQLTNDAGFITKSSVPTNVSAFTNDAGYAKKSELPTKLSQLANDAGYITDSYIELQTPTSNVVRLDASAEVPFKELNAPNGSTVSIYGKNLLERKIRSDGLDDVYSVFANTSGKLYYGYNTDMLPAGEYTVRFTCKDQTDIPVYIYFNAKYSDGTTFSESKKMTQGAEYGILANPITVTLEKSGQLYIYAAGAPDYIDGARNQFAKIATLQIEAGTIATDYEDYKEPKTVTMPVAEMPTAYFPITTVLCNEGCSVKYKANPVIAYNNLLKRVVALEAAAVNNI